MRHRIFFSTATAYLVLLTTSLAPAIGGEPTYRGSFDPNGWHSSDWLMVKSPRFDYLGQWLQKADGIENQVPANAAPHELMGSRAGETYTSMVLKDRFRGSATIQATMSFADQMAPLIVIASDLGADQKGRPEYRDHYEIVLWNEGVNVWHHGYAEGKPSWQLAAYAKFPLKANTRYEASVQLKHEPGVKSLTVRVADHEFGFSDPALPDLFFAGITACEGVNRFYDFSIAAAKDQAPQALCPQK